MIAALLAAALFAIADAPSPVPSPGPSGAVDVSIAGAFARPGAVFDAAARARLPAATASVVDPDKTPATYSGVLLADVLHDAGANVGDAVRGSAARAFVIVRAADGYSAIFSLAETRTSEARCAPLIASARNGAPLAPGTGPFRIVAPCDETHARWVRGIVALEIVVAPGATATAAADAMHHDR